MTEIGNKFRENELQGCPDLLKSQKPNDPIGCQRVMLSADYFSTLKKPNVKVVQCQKMAVSSNSIIADEKAEEEIDVSFLDINSF